MNVAAAGSGAVVPLDRDAVAEHHAVRDEGHGIVGIDESSPFRTTSECTGAALTCDGTICVLRSLNAGVDACAGTTWCTRTGKLRHVLWWEGFDRRANATVAVDARRTLLASCDERGSVAVWRASDGELLRRSDVLGPGARMWWIRISADERKIVVVCRDRAVRLRVDTLLADSIVDLREVGTVTVAAASDDATRLRVAARETENVYDVDLDAHRVKLVGSVRSRWPVLRFLRGDRDKPALFVHGTFGVGIVLAPLDPPRLIFPRDDYNVTASRGGTSLWTTDVEGGGVLVHRVGSGADASLASILRAFQGCPPLREWPRFDASEGAAHAHAHARTRPAIIISDDGRVGLARDEDGAFVVLRVNGGFEAASLALHGTFLPGVSDDVARRQHALQMVIKLDGDHAVWSRIAWFLMAL